MNRVQYVRQHPNALGSFLRRDFLGQSSDMTVDSKCVLPFMSTDVSDLLFELKIDNQVIA